MTQAAVPDSTLINGGWAPMPGIQPRHQVVDEGVSSHDGDTSYVTASASTAKATALGLASLADPAVDTGHVVRWVAREVGSTANKQFKIELRRVSDNFKVHDTGWQIPGASYAAGSSTLSEAEAANITDYGDLGVVIKVNSITSWGASNEIRVTAIELEVPDAPPDEDIRLTQIGAEVLAKAPDPDARLTQFGYEVLATPIKVRLTQHGYEILAAAGDPALQLTAIGFEVLADRGIVDLQITQAGYEVLADAGEAELRVTAIGAEVLGKNPLPYMRITQTGMELLSRRVQSDVVPGDDPDTTTKLFLHNWRDPIRVETAWLTDITKALTGAEERRSIRDRPTRSMAVLFHGLTQEEATGLWMNLLTFAKARLLMPLYTDYAKLTGPSSGSTLPCDPTLRRFFPGCRVVIHYWERRRFPTMVEYGRIESVGPDGIVLKDALAGSFPANARVYPVIECEANVDQIASAIADERSEMRLQFHEVTGQNTLPSSVPPMSDLGDVESFRGHPILPLRHAWQADPEMMVRQEGDRYASGRGFVTDLRGDPKVGWVLFFRGRDRKSSWDILTFFESRMGRTRPFWAVAPIDLFSPVGLTTTEIHVRQFGELEQLEEFVKYIAIVGRDGSVGLRGVDSIVSGTHAGEDVWTITFDEAFTQVVSNLDKLARVTFAHLLRADQDYVTEEWTSTEMCSIFVPVIEVPEEKEVELVNLTLPAAIQSAPQSVADLKLWVDASRGCDFEGKAINPATDNGDDVDTWNDYRRPAYAGRLEFSGFFNRCQWHHPPGDRPALYWKALECWKLLGDQSPLHSNTLGLTIFLLVRKGSTSLDGTNPLFERTDALVWHHDQVDIFEDLGSNNNGFSYGSLMNSDPLGTRSVLALTWSPGTYCRVYKDGVLAGEATTQTTDIPEDAADNCFLKLPLVAGVDNGYWSGGLTAYGRALTVAEMNAIGRNYAGAWRADTPWTDIT